MTNREFIDLVAPEHKLLTCVEGKAVNALQQHQNGVVDCVRCTLLAILPDHDADLVGRLLVSSSYKFELTMTHLSSNEQWERLKSIMREDQLARRS